MKKVIVISTSLRPGSNSHVLAEQFAKLSLATLVTTRGTMTMNINLLTLPQPLN